MSTMKRADPVIDAILDFVARFESTGNYNAVIGDAHATDDLSALTLGQIKTELMPRLLSEGQPSTAVGRYQIIRQTFEMLQGELGADDYVLFTPTMQDRMAGQLLMIRHLEAWERD